MTIQSSIDRVEIAGSYADMGWYVFPLAPGTKDKPVVKWSEEKTIDHFQIVEWWSENPEYNIAIATGEQSNLSVVDIDNEDALNLFRQYAHLFPEKPNLVAKTPRGYHIYYQYTPLLKQGADVFVVKENSGIDIRSEGGYVVAPSSIVTAEDKGYYQELYRWI